MCHSDHCWSTKKVCTGCFISKINMLELSLNAMLGKKIANCFIRFPISPIIFLQFSWVILDMISVYPPRENTTKIWKENKGSRPDFLWKNYFLLSGQNRHYFYVLTFCRVENQKLLECLEIWLTLTMSMPSYDSRNKPWN